VRKLHQGRDFARISAAHSREDLEFAPNAFAEVNEELK
jgi:hypothetical protein